MQQISSNEQANTPDASSTMQQIPSNEQVSTPVVQQSSQSTLSTDQQSFTQRGSPQAGIVPDHTQIPSLSQVC